MKEQSKMVGQSSRTKLLFWLCVSLLVGGAYYAGNQSGRTAGAIQERGETKRLLREFAQETDLVTHLKSKGQEQWLEKWGTRGLWDSLGYVRTSDQRSAVFQVLFGVAVAAIGLIGLLYLSKSKTAPSFRPVPS